MAAHDAERARLGDELHDGPVQAVAVAVLRLGLAARSGEDVAAAEEAVVRGSSTLRAVLADLEQPHERAGTRTDLERAVRAELEDLDDRIGGAVADLADARKLVDGRTPPDENLQLVVASLDQAMAELERIRRELGSG